MKTCRFVSKSSPEEHLLEHAVGRGHARQTASRQGVQLQVGGDDLRGHLGVGGCSRPTTTGTD